MAQLLWAIDVRANRPNHRLIPSKGTPGPSTSCPFLTESVVSSLFSQLTFVGLYRINDTLLTLSPLHDSPRCSAHSVSHSSPSHSVSFCSQLTFCDAINRLLGGVCCLEEMAASALDDEHTFDPQFPRPWDTTPSCAPTPGYIGRDWTPSLGCASPEPEQLVNSRSEPPDSVSPLHLVDDEGTSGDRIGYTYLVEWRVTLNHRVIAKDTEQDLSEPPSVFWPRIEQEAVKILRSKIAHDRRVRLDDTNVVVSVNDRSQRDLIKRFDSTDINWTAIEKQLRMWAELARLGKQLRLKISVNYIEDSSPLRSRYDKRGKSSVSKRMLADRDAQLDAEEVSGQPSVWRRVYSMMRCPGPPCRHDGQYCWQDPAGKRHYKLRTHQLRSLVRYVEKGGDLETHDDIPDSLREQLYAEDNERTIKQKSHANNSPGSMCPPININVLPNQGSQAVVADGNSASSPSRTPPPDPIEIPGLHDVAVVEYSDWQQSRVSSETLKNDIRKARDLVLANGLDLKQIHVDQDPDFFIKQGVKVGVARRFVCEITEWASSLKQAVTEIN